MTTGQEALSSSERWRLAWQYSYPIALGYVPAAIAFGVLMSAAGLPTWLALAMSVIVYSGAAQYAAVALFADWAGVFTLTLNTYSHAIAANDKKAAETFGNLLADANAPDKDS